jgi:hypothetical protein
VKEIAIQPARSDLEEHLVPVRVDTNSDELREGDGWSADRDRQPDDRREQEEIVPSHQPASTELRFIAA